MLWILGALLISTALLCRTYRAEAAHHIRLNERLRKRLEELTAEDRNSWLIDHNDESFYP